MTDARTSALLQAERPEAAEFLPHVVEPSAGCDRTVLALICEAFDEEELTGGDFVRTMKQLIDILRQVATIAPDPGVRRAAADAVDGARRGVVLDGSAAG